jgi:hypothetical protein
MFERYRPQTLGNGEKMREVEALPVVRASSVGSPIFRQATAHSQIISDSFRPFVSWILLLPADRAPRLLARIASRNSA